jgi:Zn-finger nucleic acid-binding protein
MFCPMCGKELILVIRQKTEYDYCDENFDYNSIKI